MSSDVPKLSSDWLTQRETPPSSGGEPVGGTAETKEQPREGSRGEAGGPDFLLEEPSLGANLDEIIQLGAVDPLFYNQCWFPKTFRQAPATFHPKIYEILDNPANRYVNIQVMRDGAKTTIFRAYASRRIAYGLSRTILYVAQNETKAKQSVGWIKHQVETNTKWAQAFALSKGKPWSEEHICILHGVEQHKVHVLAFGITGGLRGINLDDWRPDLIVVDDAISDENAATQEQRDKVKNIVFGAVKESLARRSEVPDAKLAILNTPLDFDDLSEVAKKDPQFISASFGCWTEETKNLNIEDQESSWPAAYPSEELRGEKRAAIAMNRYPIFAREKEVNLIHGSEYAFKSEWLEFYGMPEDEYQEVPLDEAWVEMAIDPVPPPTDKQLEEGLKKKDYESIAVAARWKGKFFLLDQVHNRGHDPSWTISTVFELARRWRVRKIIVETVAYQKVLEWLLKEAMRRTGRYWLIEPFDDKRKKFNRITDALTGVASEGALYVKRSHTAFINQFSHFGGKNPEGQHDDDLESVAVVVHSLHKGYVGDVAEDWYTTREALIPDLRDYRGAP